MFIKKWVKISAVLLAVMVITSTVFAASLNNSWPSAGQNLSNTRYQDDTSIKLKNVANLNVKWQFQTAGDVSATASVDDNVVYFPDWGGYMNAVNKNTGVLVWKHKVSDYTGYVANPAYGITDDIARDTPAIDAKGKQIIFGDQAGYHGGQLGYVMAVDSKTGDLNWKTQVGSVFTIVTQSPVVDDTTVYVGVASAEEAYAGLIPNYPCCSFRAAMYALDTKTGAIKWQTYTVPSGYSGGSIWGSTPVVDKKRNSLYITTGNNYSVPAAVQTCILAAGSDNNAVKACISPDDHFDSIIALNLATGAVKWAFTAISSDGWNVSCFPGLLPPGVVINPQNCPAAAGPDYDFGQGVMLYNVNGQDYVGAGQKSGQFWSLNADTGAVSWMAQAAPGGIGGGLQWGSSTDGKNIYFASANTLHKDTTLINGQHINYGFWGALDAATGTVVWQTPDPQQKGDSGPVASIKGVVFACSMDPAGNMYALDSSNGHVLWSFPSGGSCLSGAAIVGGTVYWGSGYANFGAGTPNNKFYAFDTK